ncbi:hypothetical protein BDZ89DRAFT_1150148 [Hymenopellis radicata]|nr:hypothetical protein BDZ89DRAFT_1150148 [Hymenopellis radicata]
MSGSSPEDLGLSQADVKYLLSTSLNAYILEIFYYAAYSVVYMLSMYLIVFNSKVKLTPQRKALVGVITVLWVVLTMRVGCVWHFVNATYIEHGASREDEFQDDFGRIKPEAVEAFGAVLLYTLILLADLVMIWRTWAIYARRWLAIVLPVLTMLTGLVAVGIELALAFFPPSAFDSGHLARLGNIDWNTIYFSMIVCTNTLCTILILGRIIFLTGWHHALRTYGGIITILVESAFIYSGAFIIDLAMVVAADNSYSVTASYLYMDALLPSITCVAPTLIVLRVASGHSVTTSVVPSTSISARIQFSDRGSDVDLENNGHQ